MNHLIAIALLVISLFSGQALANPDSAPEASSPTQISDQSSEGESSAENRGERNDEDGLKVSEGSQTEPVSEPSSELTSAEAAAIQSALASDERTSLSDDFTSQPPALTRSSAGGNMNPNISFILDFAAAYFTEQDSRQMGAHDPSDIGFNLQQLELHIDSRVDPYFEFQANIVMAQFGLEIEEVYARTLAMPYGLQMKIGQFLLPFGRFNPTHPHAWNFLNQPLILGKFMGSESARGMGVETSWLAPLPWFVELSVGVTQSEGECCARSFFNGTKEPIDGFEDFILFSRLAQFFDLGREWGLLLGASHIIGENKSGLGNLSQLIGGDLFLRYRKMDSPNRFAVQLQLEWAQRSRQVPGDVLHDDGGLAELVIQWSPAWAQGFRWELVDGIADDPLNPEWTSARQRLSTQVTWYPSHFSRLRLQLGRDDADWLPEDIWSVMLGLEVLVGAHGAHSY